MTNFIHNDDFFTALRALIDKWCERRCLCALSNILGAYLAFNGLTDGWAEVRVALQNVRAFARTELQGNEVEELNDLIRIADNAITRDR